MQIRRRSDLALQTQRSPSACTHRKNALGSGHKNQSSTPTFFTPRKDLTPALHQRDYEAHHYNTQCMAAEHGNSRRNSESMYSPLMVSPGMSPTSFQESEKEKEFAIKSRACTELHSRKRTSLTSPLPPLPATAPRRLFEDNGQISKNNKEEEDSAARRLQSSFEKPNVKKTHIPLVVVAATALIVIIYSQKYHQQARTDLLQKIQKQSEELRSITMEKNSYQQTLQQLGNSERSMKKAAIGMHEELVRSKSERKFMLAQMELLKKRIQMESHRTVSDSYGEGPYRVAFQLNLTTTSEKNENNTIVLQTAPLDQMPHSIHMFLNAVEHKLWEGKSFWLNAPHIFQASSDFDPYEDNDANSELKKLSPQSFSVSFPEYNPNYPHKPFTVGFAGTPGGPDLYISKKDNSASHGPNRQQHHVLEGDADPCFAEVVEGWDVLQIMEGLETDRNVFKVPVRIERVEML